MINVTVTSTRTYHCQQTTQANCRQQQPTQANEDPQQLTQPTKANEGQRRANDRWIWGPNDVSRRLGPGTSFFFFLFSFFFTNDIHLLLLGLLANEDQHRPAQANNAQPRHDDTNDTQRRP